MLRREFLVGMGSLALSPQIFASSEDHYRKLVQEMERFVMEETFVGEEITRVNDSAGDHNIHLDTNLEPGTGRYIPEYDKITYNFGSYKDEFNFYRNEDGLNTKLIVLAHEKIHRLQYANSDYRCLSLLNRILDTDTSQIPENYFSDLNQCLNQIDKNAQEINTKEEVENELENLKTKFGEIRDQFKFIIELHAHSYFLPGMMLTANRDRFFERYGVVPDDNYNRAYSLVLEDVIYLHGTRRIGPSSKFIGQNCDSINKLKSAVNMGTGLISRERAFFEFKARERKMADSFREIGKYARNIA